MADEETQNPQGEEEEEDEITWEDAFNEAAQGQAPTATHEADESGGPEIEAQPAPPAPELQPSSVAPGSIDIDFLLDVSLNVTVEVGRRKMLIKEMLQLGQGSIIPLEKEVGEPMQVYVNGKLLAFGEVVTVNEKFGIRLTDIIDPKSRIEQLR